MLIKMESKVQERYDEWKRMEEAHKKGDLFRICKRCDNFFQVPNDSKTSIITKTCEFCQEQAKILNKVLSFKGDKEKTHKMLKLLRKKRKALC